MSSEEKELGNDVYRDRLKAGDARDKAKKAADDAVKDFRDSFPSENAGPGPIFDSPPFLDLSRSGTTVVLRVDAAALRSFLE